jgi:hypothetical protein
MKNDERYPSQSGEPLETNPLFPSGEWEGFYTHEFGPHAHRHMMSFTLTFKNGTVSGSGIDDVAYFTWRGRYDTKTLRCSLHKKYPSHTVFYDGYVDQNGIWGTWEIPPFNRGGFHLWPKGLSENITTQDKEQVPEFFKMPELI